MEDIRDGRRDSEARDVDVRDMSGSHSSHSLAKSSSAVRDNRDGDMRDTSTPSGGVRNDGRRKHRRRRKRRRRSRSRSKQSRSKQSRSGSQSRVMRRRTRSRSRDRSRSRERSSSSRDRRRSVERSRGSKSGSAAGLLSTEREDGKRARSDREKRGRARKDSHTNRGRSRRAGAGDDRNAASRSRSRSRAHVLGDLGKPRQPRERGLRFDLGESPRPQDTRFLCVLDFEATCCDRDSIPRAEMEVIELPSVLLDSQTGRVVAEFRLYVQPEKHPVLTSFCTDLTGIRQRDVDAGVPFAEALAAHTRWLRAHGMLPSGGERRVTFVTVGDWDLETCLPNQCRMSGVPIPKHYTQWVNIKHVYTNATGKKAGGMRGMLDELGLTLEGRHHSGLDDCRNTAKLALRLLEKGMAFQSHHIMVPTVRPAKAMVTQEMRLADRKKEKDAHQKELNKAKPRCTHCGEPTVKTWRNGPKGIKAVCSACKEPFKTKE